MIVFRCDSSLTIGTGHVIRCRNLARSLQSRGVDVSFICRSYDGDLISILQQEFNVIALKSLNSSMNECSDSLDDNIYANWLGCSEVEDSAECLSFLSQSRISNITHLVVDHYSLGYAWEEAMISGIRHLCGTDVKLFVIDDLANRRHLDCCLVDVNRSSFSLDNDCPYVNLLPATSQRFLGPSYALIDSFYSDLSNLLPTRSRVSRVCIFFGGVDADNYSRIAVLAFDHPKLKFISVDLVVGKSSPHKQSLEDLVSSRNSIHLHYDLPSLAGLMARSDVSIGAAGTTGWERACLGLPSLVIPIAENQNISSQYLERFGAAEIIRPENGLDALSLLQESLIQLVESPDKLYEMSESCFQLCDGRGLARVASLFVGPSQGLSIRHATCSDLGLYYIWVNDPEVRKQSFNINPISFSDHKHWFLGRLASSSALLLVLQDGKGLPLGQIRFELLDDFSKLATISLSLDTVARGRRLSSALLRLGCEELMRCWGPEYKAYGKVRSTNVPSCLAFLKTGFSEVHSTSEEVRTFVKLGISSNDSCDI